MDFMCYATVAMLRQRDNAPSTDTKDDVRRLMKLRDVSTAITRYCGERYFEPYQATHPYDWTSNEYMSFKPRDLLTLTSLTDGTGNVKKTGALIMQGKWYSDATTYGPWYSVRMDTTQDLLLYNVVPFMCMKVAGVWGYHDDYGISGANAWTPVFTDGTFATPLAPSGNVLAADRVITLNGDPNTSYDTYFQAWPSEVDGIENGAVSPGALIQLDSEWLQVLAVAARGTTNKITVTRAANGTTAATHNSSSTISVFQPVVDIREATLRWAQYLMRTDGAPFGKILKSSMGAAIIPYEVPPDALELLDHYEKRLVS